MKQKQIEQKQISDEEKNMAETKFHYGQLVKITRGFYKGITARIHDFRQEEIENQMTNQAYKFPKIKTIYYKLAIGNTKDLTLKILWINEDMVNRTLF